MKGSTYPALPVKLEVPTGHAMFFRDLVLVHWWRLLPYGYWIEANGTKVIFDREYYPICRLHPDGSVEFLPPETWIRKAESERFYYGELEAPYQRAETLPRILAIAREIGMEVEFASRCAETDNGARQMEVWRKPWLSGFCKPKGTS